MKKRSNNSTRASALQITLSVALMALSAILFASSFKAAPQATQEGFYPPLPNQQTGFYPPLPNQPDGVCPSVPVAVSLPVATIGPSPSGVILVHVSSSLIDSTTTNGANLVGFQGDFTFDSTVINFNSPFVQRGGLTSDSNWNVSGNVLTTTSTIKTLRISAFMNTFTPLAGGPDTLFDLRVQASATAGSSTLTWAPATCVAGGQGNEFIFIDDNLISYDVTPQGNGLITIAGGASPTPTATFTPTATATATFTPTATATATFTPTATATATFTPTATATFTPTATATFTPTATATFTPSATATFTPTATATFTPTATATAT